jgi:hypothetical protein
MPQTTPSASEATPLPEHAKVVDRISDLHTRIGELRRHL